jgi:adenine deaminase
VPPQPTAFYVPIQHVDGRTPILQRPVSAPVDGDALAFIEALPKTETHLHLEGALPWELLRRLDAGRFRDPPASWRGDFRFESFQHFEDELLGYVFAWFDSPERYHEAARAIFATHVAQNVKYVECSFASGVLEFGGVDGEAVTEAIRAAVPDGLEVRIFMGIHRNGRTDRSRSFLDACLDWGELDGLDLHGLETVPLEPWTAELWQAARAAGKHTKAHAGEFAGAESVRQVLDELGVRRIQHGTRSVEDPAVVDRLARDGIALDMCPISNLKLGVAPTLAEHPIRRLLDAGVVCTVSTDDPISFGNTLTDEYLALASHLDFSRAELAQVALNGFRVALCDAEVTAPWVAELEARITPTRVR